MRIMTKILIKNRRILITFGVAVFLLFFCTSCASKRAVQRRPLTEKESNVKLVGAEQEITLRLKEACKPIGKVETLNNEYDIAVRTATLGGNVAQVLNSMQKVSGHTPLGIINPNAGTFSYDVRFWKCP